MKSWKTKTQMSESMALAVFLTLAGGFQDAYSYNCRGKVFANAQTGNLVLLGQNLAMGNWPAALHYVIPLAAFLSGVYVTEWVHQRCPGLPENPLEADRPACGGAPADGRRADAAVGQYAGQCLPVVCLRYAGQ